MAKKKISVSKQKRPPLVKNKPSLQKKTTGKMPKKKPRVKGKKLLISLNLPINLKKGNPSRYLSPLKPLSPFVVPFFLFLTALFIILSHFVLKDKFQLAKEELAMNQNDFENHLFLAEEFLKNNQIEEAEKELVLARFINPDDARTKELWQKKMESNPKDIPLLIAEWEKILALKPGYRDGHLQVAALNFKIGEIEIARFHLQEAINLDPNFEPARELERELDKE